MAVVNTGPFYERMRELLEAGAGSMRAIAAGTFKGGLPDEQSDRNTAVKLYGSPRCEALIVNNARSPASPPIRSDLAIYAIDVRVRVVRLLGLVEQVTDSDRDEVKALAASDADLLRQSLEAGNLAATEDGRSTGVVSGMLSYRDSKATVRRIAADALTVIETDHMFHGSITSTPDTP